MPKEIIYVFVAFIVIAAIYFMYSSLRVNRKEGETSSVKDDSKKVAKMVFRYIAIAITFVVCMVVLVAVESQFVENLTKDLYLVTLLCLLWLLPLLVAF